MEVRFAATVTGAPHRFFGTATRSEHESFPVRTDAGAHLEIVANLSLSPWLEVRPGDRVVVDGELVRPPGREALVHWTHHDPAGRHAAGFIEWNGRRYA
jgi:hypothetical protein